MRCWVSLSPSWLFHEEFIFTSLLLIGCHIIPFCKCDSQATKRAKPDGMYRVAPEAVLDFMAELGVDELPGGLYVLLCALCLLCV